MEPDLTNQIIDYENGDMDEEELVELFQALIDNGMAWTLQGSYGRVATDLIENGMCHAKGENYGETVDN